MHRFLYLNKKPKLGNVLDEVIALKRHDVARNHGIDLIEYDSIPGFRGNIANIILTTDMINAIGTFDGVVVDDTVNALSLSHDFLIGIFSYGIHASKVSNRSIAFPESIYVSDTRINNKSQPADDNTLLECVCGKKADVLEITMRWIITGCSTCGKAAAVRKSFQESCALWNKMARIK